MAEQYVSVDFETFSRADLGRTGGPRYAQDDSTRMLCLGMLFPGESEPVLWHPRYPQDRPDLDCTLPERGAEHLARLHEHVRAGGIVRAWNAAFERAIWYWIGVLRHGWPTVAIQQWRCTQAEAGAAGLPLALAAAADVVGAEQRKDARGKELIKLLCKPRRVTRAIAKADPSADDRDQSPALLGELFDYCLQDVRTEADVCRRIPRLPPDSLQRFFLDAKINDRGAPVDRRLCEAAIALDETARARALPRLRELIPGVTSFYQHKVILAWLRERGYPFASKAGESVDAALACPHTRRGMTPEAVEVLRLCRIAGGVTVSKYRRALECVGLDRDVVRGSFQIFGAGPGRWAGRLVQTQNIKKGLGKTSDEVCRDLTAPGDLDPDWIAALWGNPLKLVGDCARGLFAAPEGFEFVAGDFSGAEVRGAAWVAGAKRLLALLRAGADPYIDLAASVFGADPAKLAADRKNEDAPGHKDAVFKRDVGKAGILGLGFGLGAAGFLTYCIRMGAEIDLDLAERTVQVYRSSHHEIPRMHRQLAAACIRVAGGPWSATAQVRGLSVFKSQRFKSLLIKLPSGRCIAYRNPRVVQDLAPWDEWVDAFAFDSQHGQSQAWGPETTHGGRLFENVVQGTCNDLQAAAMWRIEMQRGWPIVLHTHDDVISCVPKGAVTTAEFEAEFCRSPAWAATYPAAAEAWIGPRYRK